MSTENPTRKPDPSGVRAQGWALMAPYPTMMGEDAQQREHSLREVFNGLRYIVRTGAQWDTRHRLGDRTSVRQA